MSSTTKNPQKRSGDRRASDRRKTALPNPGRDRRVTERRAGRDRRD